MRRLVVAAGSRGSASEIVGIDVAVGGEQASACGSEGSAGQLGFVVGRVI